MTHMTPDQIVAYLQVVLHQIAQLPAEDQEQWLVCLEVGIGAVEKTITGRPVPPTM